MDRIFIVEWGICEFALDRFLEFLFNFFIGLERKLRFEVIVSLVVESELEFRVFYCGFIVFVLFRYWILSWFSFWKLNFSFLGFIFIIIWENYNFLVLRKFNENF